MSSTLKKSAHRTACRRKQDVIMSYEYELKLQLIHVQTLLRSTERKELYRNLFPDYKTFAEYTFSTAKNKNTVISDEGQRELQILVEMLMLEFQKVFAIYDVVLANLRHYSDRPNRSDLDQKNRKTIYKWLINWKTYERDNETVYFNIYF